MRLIDADALLEDLKKTGRYFQAKFDIENAPTVTIKKWKEEMPDHIQRSMLDSLRPHGEWIKKQVTPASCIYVCSECGIEGFILDNYCPNCGAEMRGEKK